MPDTEQGISLEKLIHLAMDCMGVAVTIIDTKGKLLYYNPQAERILDRKPEYVGTDIHSHHKKAGTNPKIDLILKNFEEGRKDPFYYEAKPYGETICVTVAPIIKNDRFVGCVQTVRLKNTASVEKKGQSLNCE